MGGEINNMLAPLGKKGESWMNGTTLGVSALKFSIMGSRDLADLSTCQITGGRGKSGKGSLSDPRMGPSVRFVNCDTCKKDSDECQGHFGYIKLEKPVYNIIFIEKICKLLNMFCHTCYTMKRKPPESVQQTGSFRKRFKDMAASLSKVRTCHCEHETPVVKFSKTLNCMVFRHKNRSPELCDVHHVLKVLEGVGRRSLEELGLMGIRKPFSDPTSMIFDYLPVAPPCVRPSNTYYVYKKSSNFMTKKYRDILKLNESLSSQGNNKIEDVYIELCRNVWSIYDSNKFDKKRVLAFGIKKLLSGKHGRLRENLLGKRVDYSARSVITPDVNLDISEFGVPRELAEGFSRSMRVNKYNKNLPWCTGLAEGSEVQVPLKDGDWVVVNRQPTLQKQNMLGMKVRLMEGLAFRINPFVCDLFGADFDGDCMNFHCPVGLEPVSEVKHLMSVGKNLLSEKNCGMCCGMAHDGILACFQLTQEDCFLSKEELMNALMCAGGCAHRIPPPSIVKPRKLWAGKQLLSLLLPEDFNYVAGDVVVKSGCLVDGVVKAAQSGKLEGSLPHEMVLRYGEERALDFCNRLQKVLYQWFERNPCTLGPGDFEPPAELKDAREKLFAHWMPIIEESPTESKVVQMLREMEDEGVKILRSHLHENSMLNIALSGSKGNFVNFQQMLNFVGQQYVTGRRLNRNQVSGLTLPSFPKGDMNPASRGFIENSFSSGLSQSEYFFLSQKGRMDLTQKCINTSVSGYIQRKLSFGMQDLSLRHDGSVRDGFNKVVQFHYGGDLLHSKYLICPALDQELRGRYGSRTFSTFVDVRAIVSEFIPRRLGKPLEGGMRDWTTKVEKFSGEIEKLVESQTFRWGAVPDLGIVSAKPFATYLKHSLLANPIADRSEMPNLWEFLKERILKAHKVALAEPCEMVGIIAAQSISEPSTQMALDSLHNVGGDGSNLLSTNRLEQLIGASENVPDKWISFRVRGELSDFVSGFSIVRSKLVVCLNTSSLWYVTFVCIARELERSLRIVCSASYSSGVLEVCVAPDKDPEKALRKLFSFPLSRVPGLLDKAAVVDTTVGNLSREVETLHDPLNPGTWETRIEDDMEDVLLHFELLPTDGAGTIGKWIVRIGLDSKMTNGLIQRIADAIQKHRNDVIVVECDHAVRVRFRSVENDGPEKIELLRSELVGLRVSGIPGVVRMTEHSGRNGQTYHLSGGSVDRLLGMAFVDKSTVRTNDVKQVEKLWGIEACRFVLYDELVRVSSDNVNHRHVGLLADKLTRDGCYQGFKSTGFSKSEDGVLKNVCFEKPFAALTDACLFGKTERFKDICSQMVFGKRLRVGTGIPDIILDTSALPLGEDDSTEPLVETPYAPNSCGTRWSNPPEENPMTPEPGSYWEDSMLGPPTCGPERFYPTSPAYDPSSTAFQNGPEQYSPTEKQFYPTSPAYDPSTPAFQNGQEQYSPTAKQFHPTSPAYDPEQYGPTVNLKDLSDIIKRSKVVKVQRNSDQKVLNWDSYDEYDCWVRRRLENAAMAMLGECDSMDRRNLIKGIVVAAGPNVGNAVQLAERILKDFMAQNRISITRDCKIKLLP